MRRTAIFCPGRGSYTRRTRGGLRADHPWVQRAEELRAGYGLPSLLELDQSAKWRPDVLRADNVSPLIYVLTMLDTETVRKEGCVCVGGNSMGWYSALAVAGALSFEDGFRLVQEMSILQLEHEEGGQVVYPLLDEAWRRDPALERSVGGALASADGAAFPSIALGGYAVLAGTEAGVRHLLEALPRVERGSQAYPYRLARHGPYHTPLLEPVAAKARERLGDLAFRRPEIALIDGRGARHTPWSADPGELAAYTLGPQIVTPFGFTTSVRVALREYAPELLCLPGPGNSLGGACGQIVAMEGYRGITDRASFDRVQDSEAAVVWSMHR